MSFKKRGSSKWTDTPNYIMGTSIDTITTLPIIIYTNDTTATVGLKGQMEQNGTPTPTTPIQPSECGDLETVGVKVGQYKIPISSAGQTTTVYLGEVETTRRIKKLVLTGEENTWVRSGAASNTFYFEVADYLRQRINITICSHYTSQANIGGGAEMRDGNVSFYANAGHTGQYFFVRDSNLATVTDLKSYLAAQYAAGTPVTIWYVLATPTTGIVNEPIRKIGNYADEVSGITIPTIAGANTISIGTTLEPSEVSINYKGWHPITDVHRFNGTSWG